MLQIDNQPEEKILEYFKDNKDLKMITHLHFSPSVDPKLNLRRLIKIINAKCPNLERAELFAPQFTEEHVIHFVKNRSNLKQLHISTPLSDPSLTFISLTCRLVAISLLDNYLVTDEGLLSILNPQLTYLNLRGCTSLKGEFLKFLSKEVQVLKIDKTNIDTKFLRKFLPNFTKLSDLRISNVDDMILATISASCKSLQVLDIQSSPQITDLWVGLAVSQSPNLIRLNVAWCPNLTGAFLKGNGSHPKLAELWLTGLQKLNVKLLKKFIAKAPAKLKILHVAGVIAVDDSLLETLPVQELNLLNCQNTSISPAGIEKFQERVKTEERTSHVKFFY